MWKKISSIILRNRVVLLIIIGIITIIMGYFASTVKMDYNYASMLPKTSQEHIENKRYKEIFGEEANAVIVGFSDSNFFELNKFKAIQDLTASLQKIDYITYVLSFNEAINLKQVTVKDENGKSKRQFETYKIFPKDINSQSELDSLKNIFYNLPFYDNLLYSKEANVFLMSIYISEEIINSKERIPIVNAIRKNITDFSEQNNIESYISGHPYIRTQMMDMIQSEIVIFVILAALVCVGILFLIFKSFNVITVALFVVLASVLWGMGLMGILGFKITVLTAIIPPLLIVIGIPNTIFLLNKYLYETKQHGNKILALQRVIMKTGNAIFLTNLTTAVGFATFIVTQSAILVEFGVIASLGIIFVMLNALIIIPSVFSFLSPPSQKYTKHLDSKAIRWVQSYIIHIVTLRRPLVYIAFSGLLILSIFGISRIQRTGYIMDDIPHDNKLYTDLKFLEKHFKGVSPLKIAIEFDADSLSDMEMITLIQNVDSLQTRLEKHPELSKTLSISNTFKFLYQAFSKGAANKYTLPPNLRTYEVIVKRLPNNNINDYIIGSFIDSTMTKTSISMNVADIGTDKMIELVKKIRSDIEPYFPKEEASVLLTGSTILYTKGSTYLTNNLFISLGLALIIIAAFLFWMFRSFRMTIISLIPNIIPMILTAAVMGFFNIPIKPSTVLVFSVAFGISVDDTIHFLSKYRQELKINNWNIKLSTKHALIETSMSMMYTSVVLFFGFSIFIFSNFGGTVAMGLLIAIALFIAMFSNLILLPSLLLSLDKFISKKEFKEPVIQIIDEEESKIKDIINKK